MLTNPPVPFDFCVADPISRGPSRGLLRDCTTGCGTDGALHSTNCYVSAVRGCCALRGGGVTTGQAAADIHRTACQ